MSLFMFGLIHTVFIEGSALSLNPSVVSFSVNGFSQFERHFVLGYVE